MALRFNDTQRQNTKKKLAKLPFAVERDFYKDAKIKWIGEDGTINDSYGAIPLYRGRLLPYYLA